MEKHVYSRQSCFFGPPRAGADPSASSMQHTDSGKDTAATTTALCRIDIQTLTVELSRMLHSLERQSCLVRVALAGSLLNRSRARRPTPQQELRLHSAKGLCCNRVVPPAICALGRQAAAIMIGAYSPYGPNEGGKRGVETGSVQAPKQVPSDPRKVILPRGLSSELTRHVPYQAGRVNSTGPVAGRVWLYWKCPRDQPLQRLASAVGPLSAMLLISKSGLAWRY